jgi:hypothetical protein
VRSRDMPASSALSPPKARAISKHCSHALRRILRSRSQDVFAELTSHVAELSVGTRGGLVRRLIEVHKADPLSRLLAEVR